MTVNLSESPVFGTTDALWDRPEACELEKNWRNAEAMVESDIQLMVFFVLLSYLVVVAPSEPPGHLHPFGNSVSYPLLSCIYKCCEMRAECYGPGG